MIAVIKTGGKQYLVQKGDTITIEKLPGEVNESVSFDTVLLAAAADGSQCTVGTPTLEKSTVSGTILEQGRGKKIVIIKYKPKVRYRRKTGNTLLSGR